MEKRLENMKNDYQNIPVPKEALQRMQRGIDEAKNEQKTTPIRTWQKGAIAVAAAFAICIVSVNTSATVANAMGNVPLLGKFFEVITIRDYSEDGIHAQYPSVKEEDSVAVDAVNKDTQAYIDELIEIFNEEHANEEYASLDVTYEVLVDNDKYFSMDIIGTETTAGGYSFHQAYSIDKASDTLLTLPDLFDKGANYIDPISAEIVKQMKADENTDYFIGAENDGFEKIDAYQNFYMDENGQIVICFNEYEVGPGSIGTPKFTIPASVTDNIR